MILILRGHIKKSFDNDNLYLLLKTLYAANPELKVYIHTWSVMYNGISWRAVEKDTRPVREEMIINYFKDLSHLIKHIIIDDDSNIELIGNKEGTINNGPMPMIGWKNYWYGKYRIISYLYHTLPNKDIFVINCRFDILTVPGEPTMDEEMILDFIEKNKNDYFYANVFYSGRYKLSVDNIYLGSLETQNTLVNHFHKNLDSILCIYKGIYHQEMFVYEENERLFNRPYINNI
jgi:hypothetical protein